MKQVKLEHLKDIDFRKREVRQADHINEFKNWYNELANRPYTETTQAQLTMLSSVLWYLLPKKDYNKLTKLK
jgi:hypothetical protein